MTDNVPRFPARRPSGAVLQWSERSERNRKPHCYAIDRRRTQNASTTTAARLPPTAARQGPTTGRGAGDPKSSFRDEGPTRRRRLRITFRGFRRGPRGAVLHWSERSERKRKPHCYTAAAGQTVGRTLRADHGGCRLAAALARPRTSVPLLLSPPSEDAHRNSGPASGADLEARSTETTSSLDQARDESASLSRRQAATHEGWCRCRITFRGCRAWPGCPLPGHGSSLRSVTARDSCPVGAMQDGATRAARRGAGNPPCYGTSCPPARKGQPYPPGSTPSTKARNSEVKTGRSRIAVQTICWSGKMRLAAIEARS